MPTNSQPDPRQPWGLRLLALVPKAQFVLGEKELPSGLVMEDWEINAIRYILGARLTNLAPANGDKNGFTPAISGELLGSGISMIMAIEKPSDRSATIENEDPTVAEDRAMILRFIDEVAKPFFQTMMGKGELIRELASLRIQRDFAAGYLRGLDAIFEEDGETLKRDSAKLFLCFLFVMHPEMLRPIAGMTLTQVHEWTNGLTERQIGLDNLRKVAGEIGLKLADPGHPAG